MAALPDTGSDSMIISWHYTWRLGLRVDSNPEDIFEVEFADGTTAYADGIVRDAVWSSGGHSIRCDFLVLDNLPVDLILAKDYLFDMDVFSNCTAYLTEDDDLEHLDVCGVRLVREFGERFGGVLDQLEDDSIEDASSDIAGCIQPCHDQQRMWHGVTGFAMKSRLWRRMSEVRLKLLKHGDRSNGREIELSIDGDGHRYKRRAITKDRRQRGVVAPARRRNGTLSLPIVLGVAWLLVSWHPLKIHRVVADGSRAHVSLYRCCYFEEITVLARQEI
ncbi:hypothetical protein F4782DRAFT_530991 [Xylaria castorea]|nr:hypothetical protein F4782DRAFT_530991 [Xylaria castorea]